MSNFLESPWVGPRSGTVFALPSRGLTAAARLLAFGALGLLGPLALNAQVNVTTWRNDTQRTGQNLSETILTPANVNATQFGKLFSQPVDGYVYAQPLYLQGVTIAGQSHNVVYVATQHDSVYAFDADTNGGANAAPLWQASMLTAAHGAAAGATTVPSADLGTDIVPEVGITGTPVIDPASGTLYVVAKTLEGSAFIQRLHALDVTSGAEKFGGPVILTATVSGTGNGSSGGSLTFDSEWENQRPALLLLNGIVYIGFAAHGDNGPWHGWILGYNAKTLAQTGVFCASPNGVGSGFWMSGAGLSAEIVDPVNHPYGRMFVVTGNGDYTATSPYKAGMDFGDSVLNLDLTGGAPTIKDVFTPANQATLDANDGDQGSGGLLIVPNQTTGSYPHLLVQTGKSGQVYLLNRENLGGYNTGGNQVVQAIPYGVGNVGSWTMPAYFNGTVYYWSVNDTMKAFPLVNGALTGPTQVSPEGYGYPGANPAISANGATNGIVWTIDSEDFGSSGPALLEAHSAANIATTLYSSATNLSRDNPGPAVKFTVPTVANGKVYVGAQRQVSFFGLLNGQPEAATPVMSPGAESFTGTLAVTITDATPGSTIYYTTNGTTPTTASAVYTAPISLTATTTIEAIASAPSYLQSAVNSEVYTSSAQAAAPTFSPAGGSFTQTVPVTLADATAGAAIYYTTNGSAPTTASTLYTAPIQVASTETVTAIAVASGYNSSPAAAQTYTVTSPQTALNFPVGFAGTQGIMILNGSADLDDSRLQLTDGGLNEAGSAWYYQPVNVQAFTTSFSFQLSNPAGNGIAFAIQGNNTAALGSSGSGLGYQGIAKSLAIKFDFNTPAGAGTDSTGLYLDGAIPTLPAIDLSQTGILLNSDDTMQVSLAYNGTVLSMVVTDIVTGQSYSTNWTVNIPSIVGANTAYLGFTGGTGALTSSQKILTWTYSAGSTASPVSGSPGFSPAAGTYTGTQTVTIAGQLTGAAVYYTTNGTTPTTTSAVYSAPIAVTATETLKAIAVAPGSSASAVAVAAYTIDAVVSNPGTTYVNYPNAGFTASTLSLQGNATVTGGLLQLTSGATGQNRAAWFHTRLPIGSFTTDFTFQQLNAVADGMTFAIQNENIWAVGSAGGGLGYYGIPASVAVKFDLYNDAGEGPDSTGLYGNGALPEQPSINLTPTGVNLHSGDIMHAHMVYDGANLTMTLTDTVTNATATEVFPVNIPAIVGSGTAYVGFTGSTGNTTATQNVLSWSYSATSATPPVLPAPTFSPAAGTYTAAQSVKLADATAGTTIYYTTNGTAPTTASTPYTAPIAVAASETLNAIAVETGYTASAAATAAYAILPVLPAPTFSPAAGTYTAAQSVKLADATAGTTIYYTTNGSAPTTASSVYTAPIAVAASETLSAIAVETGYTASAAATAAYAISAPTGSTTYVSYPSGAITAANLSLQGNPTVTGGLLQLTDGGTGENRAAWYASKVPIGSFTTDFTFQQLNATGDGMTFAIQNKNIWAVGSAGGGLGYYGIPSSIAVKFDLYSNAGEGPDSTGLYTNGALPELPAINLTPTGVNLHSGDIMHAHLVYNGATLTMTLTDTVTLATTTQVFTVNIPSIVGSGTAYVGFTGSTGNSTSTQNVLSWSYSAP